MKSSIAMAALLTAIVGFGMVVPTIAQDAPAPQQPTVTAPDSNAGANARPLHRMAKTGGMRRGGLVALACSDRGATVLQRLLDRSAGRLALTADQQKLFDAFRTKALTNQTSFADSCKAARPAPGSKPDLLARFKAGLAVDQARLTALNDVLPDFEALFNSLSPDQQGKLTPHRFGMGKGMRMGGRHGGQHDHGKGGAAQPQPSSSTT